MQPPEVVLPSAARLRSAVVVVPPGGCLLGPGLVGGQDVRARPESLMRIRASMLKSAPRQSVPRGASGKGTNDTGGVDFRANGDTRVARVS